MTLVPFLSKSESMLGQKNFISSKGRLCDCFRQQRSWWTYRVQFQAGCHLETVMSARVSHCIGRQMGANAMWKCWDGYRSHQPPWACACTSCCLTAYLHCGLLSPRLARLSTYDFPLFRGLISMRLPSAPLWSQHICCFLNYLAHSILWCDFETYQYHWYDFESYQSHWSLLTW